MSELLDRFLLYFCPPPHIPSLSSCPSLSLSLWDPPIHLFTFSLPSLCFHPSLLTWPTAPFCFAQGKEPRVCVCLAACPLLSFSPSCSPTPSFPLLPLFSLSSLAFLSLSSFYSLPPSPPTFLCPLSHSPPASNHSPLHLFHSLPPFILRSPSLPPSLPRLFPGWAQEQ